jgi:hypothetical protein
MTALAGRPTEVGESLRIRVVQQVMFNKDMSSHEYASLKHAARCAVL